MSDDATFKKERAQSVAAAQAANRRDELLRIAEALLLARTRAGHVGASPEACVAEAQKLIKLVNSLKPWDL